MDLKTPLTLNKALDYESQRHNLSEGFLPPNISFDVTKAGRKNSCHLRDLLLTGLPK